MNRIKTTDILDPSIQQPFTGRSLDFLQDSSKEITKSVAISIIGDNYSTAIPYILTGLIPYGTGQYTSGYIFYNDEVYFSAGKSVAGAFVNVPVMTLTITNDPTADPITFTDSISRNVHNVRRMVLSDALSGSGTFDLSTAQYIDRWTAYTPSFSALDGAGLPVVGGVTVVGSSFFYLYKNGMFHIYGETTNVSTLINTRQIVITLPFALPTSPNSTTARGSGACKFFKTGVAGIPTVANIRLTSSGAGDGLNIEKLDGTDFGVLATYEFRFSINISVV